MNYILRINKLVLLYLFSAISLVFIVYFVPVFANYPLNTWADFYRSMGKLMGIWGSIFGISVVTFFVWQCLSFLYSGNIELSNLKFKKIEMVLFGIFLINAISFIVGIARGEAISYVLGDTLKGSFLPLFYLWAKKNICTVNQIVSFVKLVLTVEIILFIMFAVTGYIPFAQSTRTFLYTVSFTLFFEENRFSLKTIYFLLTLFALYVVVTTQAYRGTIIIFFFIVFLNVLLRYRYKSSPLSIVFGITLLFAMVIVLGNTEIKLEKNITSVSNRFNETVKKSSSNKYGVEESVFQRIGETIDVFRSFQNNSPIFFFVGFGNGAMLNNTMITPSEFSVYKSKIKHNIYVTLLGLLFRNGFIGFLLYVALFYYLLSSIPFFYKNRLKIPIKSEYVLFKVLVFYHFSVVLYSFVAYLFVGNVVIAFTIPMHIILRNKMENELKIIGQA
jgi:hypothetical protein